MQLQYGWQQQRYHEPLMSRAAPLHSTAVPAMEWQSAAAKMRGVGQGDLSMLAAAPAPVLPPDIFAADGNADDHNASEREPFDNQLDDVCGMW